MNGAGFFLVLEGPDGSGKSTLAKGLVARAAAAGVEPVAVREPGGTPAAERIREALLDPAVTLDPSTELLFIAAARAHLVQAIIRPALAAGRLVVSDRFEHSTFAYQAAGRGLDWKTVELVNRTATGGLRADLTLVLDLAPEAGRVRQRLAGKSRDRLERVDADFHRRVAKAYRELSGAGFTHLDAALRPDDLLDAAWAALTEADPNHFGTAGVKLQRARRIAAEESEDGR